MDLAWYMSVTYVPVFCDISTHMSMNICVAYLLHAILLDEIPFRSHSFSTEAACSIWGSSVRAWLGDIPPSGMRDAGVSRHENGHAI